MLKQERRSDMHRPINKDNFAFTEETPNGKRKEDIQKKRRVCEESKCNRCKLLIETCLDI